MISIVIPLYNAEKYVEKCLDSILEQSYQDFEIVIVNDGSSDNSLNVVLDYLKNTDVNHQIINQENKGVSCARNVGLNNAKGEYILFMDSDDCLSREFLNDLYHLLIESNSDFSFCDYTFISTQKMISSGNGNIVNYNRDELFDSFLKRNVSFVLPSMLFVKKFLIDNKIKFVEDIRFSEDQMFIWDVILRINKAVYLNKKMYGYYLRDNSTMTGSSYNKIENGFDQFKNFATRLEKDYPEYKDKIRMILPRWSLGTLYTAANLLNKQEFKQIYNKVEGNKILSRIIKIHEIKAYLLGFVCALSPDLLYKLCRKLKLNG